MKSTRFTFLSLCTTVLLVFVLAACGTQSRPAATSKLPSNFGQAEVTLPGFDKPQKVIYKIVDGRAIFQGDIILGDVDAEGKLIQEENQIDAQGVATTPYCTFFNVECHRYWPNGVIPYTITGNWDDPTTPFFNEDTWVRDDITRAMNHWQEKTALRFVPYTSGPSYVDFQKGSGCASHIGMNSKPQQIVLELNCGYSAIIHEIGHAVGLHHEHTRGDRDNFVTIFEQNVIWEQRYNFWKAIFAFDIGSYDYNSIMHYSCDAFSANGLPTISLKNPPPGVSCTTVGMGNSLSDGDIAAVNRIYPTYRSLGPVLAPSSGVGTATNGDNHEYLNVFARRASDNALIARWTEKGQQWTEWESLGGVITSDPAAIGRGHRVDVFARGTDGALWSKFWAGNWSGWYSLGGCLAPGSGPSVVTTGNNTLNLFVRWCDNQLYQRYFDGQNWGAWTPLGGGLTSDPAAVVSGGNVSVFVRGTDNQLYQGSWACLRRCFWSWTALGGVLSSGPAAASLSPNTIHVYARGTDNKLYQNYWNGSQWTGWAGLGGSVVSSDPDAIAWDGRLNIFVRGTDGDLWYKWWDSSGWWPQIP
jgi:hypothetical protein